MKPVRRFRRGRSTLESSVNWGAYTPVSGNVMPKKAQSLLGPEFRKIHPKLRMFANGDDEVNEVRSDFSSALRIARQVDVPEDRPFQDLVSVRVGGRKISASLHSIAKNVEASVFIEKVPARETEAPDHAKGKKSARIGELAAQAVTRGNLTTATVSLDALGQIAQDESVTFIEPGEPLKAPDPVVVSTTVKAPSAKLRRFGSNGAGNVLIGIIDVEGFDFAHHDFRDASGTGTRFVRIWDQGGNGRPSPEKLGYGSEIRQEDMNTAIMSEEGLPPYLLEPQSQMNEGSHGTHVASIAAGNLGVCPNAFIAGVSIALPREDLDRRRSFYDSTRVAQAVEYLVDLAEELRRTYELDELPVSINVSLGTNGHAHDGSSAVSRWLDAALAVPGRSVCVAAGNAGQEAPETIDDIGFVMGRIHTEGRIPARGLDVDIEWSVVGNGIDDISENELELWYSPADRFAVSIKPPDMDWIGPVAPSQFIENRQVKGGSFVSVYNELYHPANGANYIAVYLSPFLSRPQIGGVKGGIWTVRLHGVEVRDGRYHGWIERDDPVRVGTIGPRAAWRFPSFFTTQSNVDRSSVSSLACGQRVISVANLDDHRQRINVSSSQGPTRDGRFKPDVAAPGTSIPAAKGFDPEHDWVSMTGTSMASPYVCGVVGLMLARQPRLTAAQIGGIIQRTARPLPGFDYTWQNDAGYGRIDPKACLAEAVSIHDREDLT